MSNLHVYFMKPFLPNILINVEWCNLHPPIMSISAMIKKGQTILMISINDINAQITVKIFYNIFCVLIRENTVSSEFHEFPHQTTFPVYDIQDDYGIVSIPPVSPPDNLSSVWYTGWLRYCLNTTCFSTRQPLVCALISMNTVSSQYHLFPHQTPFGVCANQDEYGIVSIPPVSPPDTLWCVR